MKRTIHLALVAVLLAAPAWAQETKEAAEPEPAKQWEFGLDLFGYLVPDDQSYFSPTFRVDRKWLHLEARYNYEDPQTASLWAGYNFSVGKTLVLDFTPMFGAVFGQTDGVAPGYEMVLTYKRLELSSQTEYLIDAHGREGNFFYSWSELVYSLTDWLHAGLVAQRTRAYETPVDVDRGVSAGIAYRNVDFTTYVMNFDATSPTVVLALGFSF